MGRGQVAGGLAVVGVHDGGHLAGAEVAQAHIHVQAHDGPDHLVTEGVGLDVEPQQIVAEVVPRGVDDPSTSDRSGRRSDRRQNDEKSCSPISGSHASRSTAVERAGTHQAVAARNGSGTVRFRIVYR